MSLLRLILVAGLALPPVAFAAPRKEAPEEVELDRLAIASRLVADGLWERAATVLDELTEPPEDDLLRYHTLRGLVALQLGDPARALEAFDGAVATGEAEPVIHVQRAQALQQLDRPPCPERRGPRPGSPAPGNCGPVYTAPWPTRTPPGRPSSPVAPASPSIGAWLRTSSSSSSTSA